MDFGIKGKRVLITGSSQGIGRAIALAFAKEGGRVSVLARREDKLKELVVEMGTETQGHSYYAVDLMKEHAPTEAVNVLTQNGEPFEIVVHNLGGSLNLKNPLASQKEWNEVWTYNVGVAIEINSLILPPMQQKKWGRVIHISSISAESVHGSTPYAAAKAFLNAYVKGVGRSMAPDGIVCSALMPGAILAEGGHWDNIRKINPKKMADFLRHHHAIGRLGTAEEIAPFAVFMASEQVTFAAASIIAVDGGTM